MNIAVVANGYILRMNRWGKEIDNHDLVVRMDGYLGLVSSEIVGDRTDIWATAFNTTYTDNVFDDDRYRKFKIPIWLLRPRSWDTQNCWQVPDWAVDRIIDEGTEDQQIEIERMLRKKFRRFKAPSTGLGVLHTAMRLYPEDNINMYGYDFCEYGRRYYDSVLIDPKCDHGFDLEKLYIKGLVNENKRITCVGLQ